MITKVLTTFVLVGTVDSMDEYFATVEINMNPATEQPAQAVMPLTAFPCEINEGQTFYILKLTEDTLPVILCKDDIEVNKKSNVGE